MLDAVKLSMRITHNKLDADLASSIDAALLDMSRVGVNTKKIDPYDQTTFDALEQQCVEFYCKWLFDYLGKADAWQKAYAALRDAMSRCGDYNGGDNRE